jgi:hypothetical protein
MKSGKLNVIWLPPEPLTQYINELFGEAAFVVITKEGAPILKEEVQLPGAHLREAKLSLVHSAVQLPEAGLAGASDVRESNLIAEAMIGECEALASQRELLLPGGFRQSPPLGCQQRIHFGAKSEIDIDLESRCRAVTNRTKPRSFSLRPVPSAVPRPLDPKGIIRFDEHKRAFRISAAQTSAVLYSNARVIDPASAPNWPSAAAESRAGLVTCPRTARQVEASSIAETMSPAIASRMGVEAWARTSPRPSPPSARGQRRRTRSGTSRAKTRSGQLA